MSAENIIVSLAIVVILMCSRLWWTHHVERKSWDNDPDVYGSGLDRKSWHALRDLVEAMSWIPDPKFPAAQRDLERRFSELPAETRCTEAARHVHQAILLGDHDELDRAARLLVPGPGDPWIVLWKS